MKKILATPGSVNLATLEEYLILAKALNFFVVIELKPASPDKHSDFIDKIARTIRELELVDKIIVQSFFPDLLYLLRRKDPQIFTMLLFKPNQLQTLCDEFLDKERAEKWTWKTICGFSNVIDAVTEALIFRVARWIGTGGVVLEHNYVDEKVVEYCRSENIYVGTWTVNRKEDKERVRNLGVDFIISDCPMIHC